MVVAAGLLCIAYGFFWFMRGVVSDDKESRAFYVAVAACFFIIGFTARIVDAIEIDTDTSCHTITIDGVAYVQADCVEIGAE